MKKRTIEEEAQQSSDEHPQRSRELVPVDPRANRVSVWSPSQGRMVTVAREQLETARRLTRLPNPVVPVETRREVRRESPPTPGSQDFHFNVNVHVHPAPAYEREGPRRTPSQVAREEPRFVEPPPPPRGYEYPEPLHPPNIGPRMREEEPFDYGWLFYVFTIPAFLVSNFTKSNPLLAALISIAGVIALLLLTSNFRVRFGTIHKIIHALLTIAAIAITVTNL